MGENQGAKEAKSSDGAAQPKAQEAISSGANQDEVKSGNFLQEANHPVICLFTIGFKVAAIVSFILLNIFLANDAMVYLVVILLSSFDFWIVKNISGRVLVGLRWWNEVKADGSEVWIYESKNESKEQNADRRVFWYSTYATPVVWTILFVWDIITLKWIWAMIALICLAFSGINLYGYIRCSREQQDKIKNLGGTLIMSAGAKAGEMAANYAANNKV